MSKDYKVFKVLIDLIVLILKTCRIIRLRLSLPFGVNSIYTIFFTMANRKNIPKRLKFRIIIVCEHLATFAKVAIIDDLKRSCWVKERKDALPES
ncbi:MAG: hypothetical protein LBR10_02580 [Prevotellaceae bacterium]|nr:hypothetical protein [Prevotellaceae bacterium]